MISELAESLLLKDIKAILEHARTQVKQTVNSAMVQAYWQIGRLIVEDEQQGSQRAEYGKAVLQALSKQLSAEYGKGFDTRNLRNMRKFYQSFPNWNAVRTELSWTHYRALIRIGNEQARTWYMQEAQQQAWSARALERQMGTLYYERLLASKEKTPVEQEAQEKTHALADTNKNYLRDPYILDFLNLQDKTYQESDRLENAIKDNLAGIGYEV